MIGVIKSDFIFEFRDEDELARALCNYGEQYGSEIVIVTTTSDQIRAIAYRDKFTFRPSIAEDTVYILYGVVNARSLNVLDLQRNDSLPHVSNYNYELMVKFKCVSQPLPKQINI